MRYALLMHYREPGQGKISEEAITEAKEAFGAYGRALESAGVLLSADVLQPSAATTTVTRREGGLLVRDGPFAETKEALAGIFVLEVPDLDAAIGWAEKSPGAQWGVIEVRPTATAFVDGAWALIELSAARAPARAEAGGRFVPLDQQDPSRWNPSLVSRAHEHLRAAHARGQLGRFQLEAAIQAVHCARASGGATDWPTLLTLHRILHAVAPSLGSGVALAAVTAEIDGPAAGLAALDELLAEAGQHARRFQPARATRAHLLDRLGRKEEAVAAYESAISLTHDTAERQYLEHRRGQASPPGRPGPLAGRP